MNENMELLSNLVGDKHTTAAGEPAAVVSEKGVTE